MFLAAAVQMTSTSDAEGVAASARRWAAVEAGGERDCRSASTRASSQAMASASLSAA